MAERPSVPKVRAKHVATVDINGKPVSFFTPPHDEPDFLWVDLEALAKAFLPRAVARRMTKEAHRFIPGQRSTASATVGDRIVTIGSHPMAQGLAGFADTYNGHGRDMNGPAYKAYCNASADVEIEHRDLSFEQIAAAFHNAGGPFMRGFDGKPTNDA